MKNTTLKVLLFMILGICSPLFATAFVSMTNPLITPAPLDRVEDGGEGIVTFRLQETFGGVAPASDMFGEYNLQISVELNKLALKNDDISLMSGELLNYFTVTYNAVDKRIIFRQRADYPALTEARIDIPVTVLENAAATDVSLNGFNANISANDIDTTADGSASSFTFTRSAPVSAPTIKITSDANNNGELVIPAEVAVGAQTNVLVTLAEGTSVGDVLTVTDGEGRTINAPVALTQEDIDNGYTLTVNTPADGETLIVKATIEDAAGNVSLEAEDSAIVKVLVVDVPAPGVGMIDTVDVNESTPTTVSTNDTTPTISGICVPTNIVTVQIDDNDIEPNTTCSPGGKFTITPKNDIAEGEHTVTATQTDTSTGRVSPKSPIDNLVIIGEAPLPTVTITSLQAGETNNTKPTINGACTVDGNVITAFVDNGAIEPTAVCTSGAYTITPNNELSEGSHSIKVEIVDNAGNKVQTDSIEISVTIPADYVVAPTVVIVEDINNDGKLYPSEITGSIDVHVTLPADIKVGDTLTIGGAKEDTISITQDMIENGYTYAVETSAIGEEIKVEAVVTNRLGTSSDKATDSVILYDTPAIEKPVISQVDGQSGTNIEILNTKPTISGTCVSGAIVTVEIHSIITTESVECDENGTFSMVSSKVLELGEYTVVARQTKDGITSEDSNVQAFKITTAVTPTPTPTPTPKPTPTPTVSSTTPTAPATSGSAISVDAAGKTINPLEAGESLESFSQPAHGTVTLDNGGTENDRTDDLLRYVPKPGYSGPDAFTYVVIDQNGDRITRKIDLDIDGKKNADNGDAMDMLSMILMMLLTSIMGLYYTRKEEAL